MRLTAILLLLAICTAPVLADPPAAEFRDGKWVTLPSPTTAPATQSTDPDLDHAARLLERNENEAALNVLIPWVQHRDMKAPLRDRALYLIAQAKYQRDKSDDRIYAFYYLDELLDEYPESALFFPALERQYLIADRFLAGHKLKFCGLAIESATDEAVEMLYRIQQRAPGSKLAEKSLLRTADFYYTSGDYELAHDAYGFYIKQYPRAEGIAKIKLRQAFSSLAQFRGVQFDPTPLVDARAELSDIVLAYPKLAEEENLTTLIVRIDQRLAAKLFSIADYYRRTHALRGAVYVYRYLILTYPQSPDVEAARKALAKMPRYALDQPDPLPGSPFLTPGEGVH